MGKRTIKEVPSLTGEVWRPIEGYPKYEVSNFGRVRSYYQKIGIVRCIVLPYIGNTGYSRHRLIDANGLYTKYSTHRLVLDAFSPNINNYPVVNHIDGNKLNNHIDNLEWCTYSHNSKHSFAMGLSKGKKGEAHACAVLTDDIVLAIRAEYLANPIKGQKAHLSRKYRLHDVQISNIILRKTWKHI